MTKNEEKNRQICKENWPTLQGGIVGPLSADWSSCLQIDLTEGPVTPIRCVWKLLWLLGVDKADSAVSELVMQLLVIWANAPHSPAQ